MHFKWYKSSQDALSTEFLWALSVAISEAASIVAAVVCIIHIFVRDSTEWSYKKHEARKATIKPVKVF